MVPHTGFVTGQSRGTQNGIPAFLCPAPSPAVTIHVIKLPFPRFVSHHSPTICSVCLTLLKSTNLYSVANSTAMASSNSPSKGPELGPITVQQIISPWTSRLCLQGDKIAPKISQKVIYWTSSTCESSCIRAECVVIFERLCVRLSLNCCALTFVRFLFFEQFLFCPSFVFSFTPSAGRSSTPTDICASCKPN